MSRFPLVVCTAILASGCAIQNTPAPSPTPEPGPKTAVIELQGKPGAVDRLNIRGFEPGERVPLAFVLGSPTPTSEWSSSAAICAIGKAKGEFLCLHYVYSADTGTLQARAPRSGQASPQGEFVSNRTHLVGTEVKLSLVLHEDHITVDLEDGEIINLRPTFLVAGYSIGCVGASCRFSYPE
jgi:hypothetical protein